jgi:exodeoxyribonuclease X
MIRVIDIETLGLDPADGVCEIGWTDVDELAGQRGVPPFEWTSGPFASLVNPGRPIPPAMSAIHHITDEMVAGAPSLAAVLADADVLRDGIVLAAHVARFERSFLDPNGANPWLDTWKVALRLAPGAPVHSVQGLRYWSKLAVDEALASPPHRAGPDAYVTALLLARMLAKMTVEDMLKVSAEPAILPRLTFGVHAMKPCAEVPSGYWEWILKQGPQTPGNPRGFDEDVRATAFHWLQEKQRRGVGREEAGMGYP